MADPIDTSDLNTRIHIYLRERFTDPDAVRAAIADGRAIREWLAQLSSADRRRALASFTAAQGIGSSTLVEVVEDGKIEYYLVVDHLVPQIRGKPGVTVLD